MADPNKRALIRTETNNKEMFAFLSRMAAKYESGGGCEETPKYFRMPLAGEQVEINGSRRPNLNGSLAQVLSGDPDEFGRITVRVFEDRQAGRSERRMQVQPSRLAPARCASTPELLGYAGYAKAFGKPGEHRVKHSASSSASFGASCVTQSTSAAGASCATNFPDVEPEPTFNPRPTAPWTHPSFGETDRRSLRSAGALRLRTPGRGAVAVPQKVKRSGTPMFHGCRPPSPTHSRIAVGHRCRGTE